MKYVLVTGAYGGMGYATVKALASGGYTVFALDKNVGQAEKNVVPIQADVTDINAVKAAFERISAVTDELFAIVHFAGIYALDSLIEIPETEFDRIFKINFYGAFLSTKRLCRC